MRKAARNQPLPQEEVSRLLSLQGPALKARCFALYQAGWTLAAIGDPLSRARSTIRSWVNTGPYSTPQENIPLPQDRSYVPKRPKKPEITPQQRQTIQNLAPTARKHRSRLPSHHPSAQANQELTALCIKLHAQGAPIQELADIAGVTYRAMYRRVKTQDVS